MRQAIMVTVVGSVFLAACGTCLATLFKWRDRVRPPVSLREALDIGEQLLGDDATNRYCVEVSIFGNPMGAPKPCTWNLFFAAGDGSKKHVYVDMDRNAKLSTWNEAIDWTKDAGRRKDLKDVQSRLAELFKKENLDVEIVLQNEQLIGSYRTRTYRVYKNELDGSYSDTLVDEIGPKHDGFSFDAEFVDEGADYYHFKSRPYWIENTQVYPTAIEGKLIVVQKRAGRDFPEELHSQIDQAFGIDFVNP
jgi:hypothetical protein